MFVLEENMRFYKFAIFVVAIYLLILLTIVLIVQHSIKRDPPTTIKAGLLTSNSQRFQIKEVLKVDCFENEQKILKHITYDSVGRDEESYKVLVLISSHVKHRYRRNSIRLLWGNKSLWSNRVKWKVVFVTGHVNDTTTMKNVLNEAKMFKDIIIEDVEESLYNLAKKVIIGLTWAKYHVMYENLLKGDDDVFVHMDNLVKFLEDKPKNVTDGYYGYLWTKAEVQRSGRYGVSKEEHPSDVYQPYCSGGGLILTNVSAQKLLKFADFNNVLKIDDAYIGELAHQAGVTGTYLGGFLMTNDRCGYIQDMMVSHPVKGYLCMKLLMNHCLLDNDIPTLPNLNPYKRRES